MTDCISSIPTLTSPVLKKLKANDISLISDTRLRKQELTILRNRLKSTHHLIGSTVPEGSNKRSETLITVQKFRCKGILDEGHMPGSETDRLWKASYMVYFLALFLIKNLSICSLHGLN